MGEDVGYADQVRVLCCGLFIIYLWVMCTYLLYLFGWVEGSWRGCSLSSIAMGNCRLCEYLPKENHSRCPISLIGTSRKQENVALRDQYASLTRSTVNAPFPATSTPVSSLAWFPTT